MVSNNPHLGDLLRALHRCRHRKTDKWLFPEIVDSGNPSSRCRRTIMTAIASPGSPIPNSAEQSGFEGPEKVLELDLVPGVGPQTGMRTLPRATWSSILDEAKCSILCKTGNQDFDAYVLSESSLFVYPHKVVVKTCGTTTLLCIIPALLRAVEVRDEIS